MGDPTQEFRERLYRSYVSTHAGRDDLTSVRVVTRADIVPHLPASRSACIVDIGCGQGLLIRSLTEFGYSSVSGVDVSPEQVAIARASGISTVVEGDFRKVLEPDSVDVLIGTDFFEHFDKYELLDAMDSCFATLRAGGLLLMRVPNASSPFGGHYRHGDVTHETSFTARSVRQLGAVTGFSSVDVYPSLPPVHGVKSSIRHWSTRGMQVVMKAALASETGQLRGHVVSINLIAVLRK